MFGWFKKSAATKVAPRTTTTAASPRRRNVSPSAWDVPPSLPEVTEGNSDADWSAWHESVQFQESTPFSPSEFRTEPMPLRPLSLDAAEQVFEQEARRRNS